MTDTPHTPSRLPALALVATLAGCTASGPFAPAAPDAPLEAMRADLRALDPPPAPVVAPSAPALTGRGMAQVSRQPGGSTNQRRLAALRAARMEAMRDLAEQIHGLQLDSETRISDAIVREDRLQGLVQGTVRGARTVRITPTSDDTYEVVMAIDMAALDSLLRGMGRRR